MAPKNDRLFAVAMGEDAVCDCGTPASTQFVISSGMKEAKGLARDVQKMRASGGKSVAACCGECMARQIVSKGFGVMELHRFQTSPIKYQQVCAHEVTCESCRKELPFGTWAYYQSDTGLGICVDCSVAKGWSNKSIAELKVQEKWIRTTIAALKKRQELEAAGLHLLEQKIDLYQIAPNYDALEGRIRASLGRLDSYLNEGLASPQEKAILLELQKEILSSQGLAAEIKTDMACRLYLLKESENTHKMTRLIADAPDNASKDILKNGVSPEQEALPE